MRYKTPCLLYPNSGCKSVNVLKKRSIFFPGQWLSIDVKSPQQIAPDRLILAFATYFCASCKWQTGNGAAHILDVTMRLRGVACTRPGCNADAAQQTKLLRFLKCSQ